MPGVYSAAVKRNTVAAVAIATAMMLAAAVRPRAAEEPRTAFAVGVLRRDSVIVPFAAFDGKRWTSPWRPPSPELTVPIDLRAVPSRWWGPTKALDLWQARLLASADPPRALRVVQPDWVDVHCVRQIGLRTDYVASAEIPPRTVQPYPKDGLAVSPLRPIEPIAVVPPEGPDAQALSRVLLEAFNSAERKIEDLGGGHPMTRRAREGVAPTIEAVYAYGDHPRVYYVEATRRYRRLGQAAGDCVAVAFGTGWFAREGDRTQSLLTVVDLLRCDRIGASYMLPLGVMREAGRLFWLAQFSGWDHERFVVAEIKPKTVEAVLSVWGGGC
jgi:hypothetical protein